MRPLQITEECNQLRERVQEAEAKYTWAVRSSVVFQQVGPSSTAGQQPVYRPSMLACLSMISIHWQRQRQHML
jgi:phosphoenolpyruvate synthase/pyruvate phosphate dikinase